MAGFFDGEGSVGIYLGGPRRTSVNFRTQIVQNDSYSAGALLDAFQRRWGGSVSAESPSRLSLGRRAANWQLSGANAAVFLSDVQPYVILKREQVDLALAWWRDRAPLQRDALGRIQSRSEQEITEAKRISQLLKELKR